MGYRHTQFRANVILDLPEDAYEINVTFNGYVGYEAHPYGSTVAYEPISSVEDIVEMEMENSTVTMQELYDRFGREAIDPLIAEAFKNAEEIQ